MQDIFEAGLGGILTKRLGMKPGGSSPAPILTPEVTPIIALEVDRPEWSFLAGELRVGTATTTEITTGAGNDASAWVVNPAGSNCLAVIEQFDVLCLDDNMCVFLWVGPVIGSQDTQAGFTPFDARLLNVGVPVSPLLFRTRNTSSAGVAILGHANTLQANGTSRMLQPGYPVILPPGTSCGCNFLIAAGAAIECSVAGRVRVLQPNELV